MSALACKFQVFFNIPDGSGGVPEPKETLDILNDDSINPEQEVEVSDDELATETGIESVEEPKEEGEEEPKEKEIKLEDVEEDEPEIPDADLDIAVPIVRKELLKEYPDIFKKFPHLEAAIYREKHYGSLFSTPEMAKEAAEKSLNFDKYSNEVLNGDLSSVLRTTKETNPQAFGKIVDNYLAFLSKAEPSAVLHVIGNIGRQFIYEMGSEGHRSNNEQLKAAAVILNQYLFGNSQFTPPQQFAKPESSEQVSEREQQLVASTFQSVAQEDYDKCRNIIKSAVAKNIDPTKVMSDFVKETAIDRCIEMVEKAISSDSRFRAHIDSLWNRAFQSNFSPDSRNRIRQAYLKKAQSLLPKSIQITRQTALKGLGPVARPDKDRQGPLPRGGSPADNKGKISKPSQIPAGMSTRDYIMSDL